MTTYNSNPTPTANTTGYTRSHTDITLTATADGLRVQKAAGLYGRKVTLADTPAAANIPTLCGMQVRKNSATSRVPYQLNWIRHDTSVSTIRFAFTQATSGTWITYPNLPGFNASGVIQHLEIVLPGDAVDVTLRSMQIYNSAAAPANLALDDSDAGITVTKSDNSLLATFKHDAANNEQVNAVSWSWGDGSAVTNQSATSSDQPAALPTVNHTFPAAGIYDVDVTVSTSLTGSAYTRTHAVSVPSGTFEAHFSYETDFLSVNVDASASLAPSLAPVDTYAWSWGDGQTTPANASKYASHTYAAPGTYNVVLTTRTNSVNRTATETRAVVVSAPPNPDNYFVPSVDLLRVAFAPSITDGTSYAWDFGDGGTSTEQTPIHTYDQPGTYNVTLTVNGTLTTTQTVTVVEHYAALHSLMEALRLEVAIPRPAGTPYNLLPNPSGELGAYGWSTPTSGSYLTGSTTSTQTADKGISGAKLIFRSSGSGSQVIYSQTAKVTAGQYAAAQLQSPYVDGYYRATVEALSAAGAVLGSSATTGFQQASASATVRTTPYLLPAGTAYARVRLNHYADTSSTTPALGKLFHFRRAMLATAAASATLTALPYAEGVDWQDLISPASEISVSRAALDVGTLSATILDSTFDPATNGTIRPGQSVRLRARTQDAAGNVQYASIFTGTVNEADVQYVGAKGAAAPGPKATKIVLSASDAITTLARINEPQGVAKIEELPEILEVAGVPFEINGSSGQVPTVQVVSWNPNASLIDQIAITRDTDAGYAFVDRDNVLQAREPAYMPTVAVGVIDEKAFSDVAASFKTDECINSVTITWLRLTPASGDDPASVEEITYGPYEDVDSITEWGLRPATFTMQGVENPTAIAARAAEILATNSQPARMITEVALPIRYQEDLVAGKALLDLYDLVRLGYERTGTDELARVTALSHKITPKKWSMTLGFSADGAVASPQTVPSPPRKEPTVGVWTDLPMAANFVAYGSTYRTPQYKIENGSVRLRGLVKTSVALTASTTLATLATYAPVDDEIFSVVTSQAMTSSASSAANTGAASTGTAHTHPIPHTHTVPNYGGRLDVTSAGVVRITASATAPFAVSGFISLSGVGWDLA